MPAPIDNHSDKTIDRQPFAAATRTAHTSLLKSAVTLRLSAQLHFGNGKGTRCACRFRLWSSHSDRTYKVHL